MLRHARWARVALARVTAARHGRPEASLGFVCRSSSSWASKLSRLLPSKRGASAATSASADDSDAIVLTDLGADDMVLSVEVVGARELNNLDVVGLSDPYCVLRLGKRQVRTSIIENNLNPIWGEPFAFVIKRQHVPKSLLELCAPASLSDAKPQQSPTLPSPQPLHLQPSQPSQPSQQNAIQPDAGPPPALEISVFDFDGVRMPDVLGVVEVSLAAIVGGLERAHGKGLRSWETFFWLGPDPELQRHGRLYLNFTLYSANEFSSVVQRHQKIEASLGELVTLAPPPMKPSQRPPPITSLPNFWEQQQTRVEPAKRRYRILSLDGGGVRGVLSAGMLHRLLLRYPRLMDSVDLITGTSTGGILALIFASGYSPEEAQRIYEVYCPPIFTSTPVRRYSLFSARYPEKAKYDAFNRYLDGIRLGDLAKHVLITSFRMDGILSSSRASFFGDVRSWRPALLSNIPRANGPVDPDLDLSAIDVAMMTSAAPTYFPPYRVGGKGSVYVDGGVFANNPSQMAVSKVRAHYPSVSLDNICVLSLGAGCFDYNLTFDEADSVDWGIRQWAPNIMNLLTDSSRLANDYTLGMMLRRRYFRLDPTLVRMIGLDAVDDIPELIEIGKTVDLSAAYHFIEDQWFADEYSVQQNLNVSVK